MNDFHQFQGFESWVHRENARAIAFLDQELREGNIVITHHLPSQASVAPRFRSHPLDPFFVCDLEDLIVARRLALWLHGHTTTTSTRPSARRASSAPRTDIAFAGCGGCEPRQRRAPRSCPSA